MTSLLKIFHCRSITLALVVSLVALIHAFGFSMRSRSPGYFFTFRFIILSVVAPVTCIQATINLIRDVERGYSPARCSLAAVLVLLAFGASAFAASVLADLLGRFV